MTRSDLSQNQIVPAARPVDAFIRPSQQNVAAPAAPQMLPNPSGIRTIGQGSGGNVQGVNQFDELARALAPFSRDLVQLGAAGLELYASDQYQKGQSEAARAVVQANQQMLASGSEYASENRRLDKADPIAALMMDRVNPFRRNGRLNRLSRAAGQAVIPEVLKEFNSSPGIANVEEGSPLLKQISASAIDRVLKRFGVDEGSPGFIEHVLPQIGQAEMKVYERHLDLRTKQMKEYAWRESAVTMGGIVENARATGTVQWSEFDPSTGRQINAVAQKGQNKAAWERGIKRLLSRELDRLADETGITGEPTAMKRMAAVQLAQVARLNGDTELLRLLGETEFGPVDKSGRRPTVAEVVGIEMFEESAKIGQLQWQEQQRNTAQGVQQFEAELATVTYEMPDGPQRGQMIDQLVRKYQAQGVPRGELMKAVQSMSSTLDAVAARSFDTAGMDALLQEMQGRVGATWNARQADQQFESGLASVAPQQRDEYRRRYADIRRTKEKEKDDAPLHLTRPIVDGKIKANLRTAYPNDISEAALRGTDVTSFMAWGDADVARSAQLQHSAYNRHVLSRLNEAAAKKGAALSSAEIIDVTTKAVEEYGTKDKENFNRLFPGSDKSNEPSVGGRARPPRSGGASPDGAKPAAQAPVVYPSGQLDNVPNRSQRLKSGETVLALPSLQEEIVRVANGEPPSPSVIRAARDAGFGNNVGGWLLREAGGYPTFTIPPAARQRLLRNSRAAQGTADAMQTSMASQGPVAMFSNWFLNTITGAAPAVAATIPPALPLPPSGQGAPTGNVGALRRAIIAKESGGNYSAVNPDSGALGIGQVMPSNVGPWTQKYLGRRLTPQQFLADRNAQDTVINGRFRDMLADQQAAGFRGEQAIRRAAAVWYSGQARLWNDTRPQFTNGRRYPSIAEYTQAIWESYKRNGGR